MVFGKRNLSPKLDISLYISLLHRTVKLVKCWKLNTTLHSRPDSIQASIQARKCTRLTIQTRQCTGLSLDQTVHQAHSRRDSVLASLNIHNHNQVCQKEHLASLCIRKHWDMPSLTLNLYVLRYGIQCTQPHFETIIRKKISLENVQKLNVKSIFR